MSDIVSKLNIICLESDAFYALVEEIKVGIRQEQSITNDKWLSPQEAMDLLKISSRSTLQKLRDEGKLRFTQPSQKMILYDRDSILSLLENNAKEPF